MGEKWKEVNTLGHSGGQGTKVPGSQSGGQGACRDKLGTKRDQVLKVGDTVADKALRLK